MRMHVHVHVRCHAHACPCPCKMPCACYACACACACACAWTCHKFSAIMFAATAATTAATAAAPRRQRFGRARHRQVLSSPSLHQSMTEHPSVSNCCRFVPVTTKALGLTLYLDPFKVRFSLFKLSIQKKPKVFVENLIKIWSRKIWQSEKFAADAMRMRVTWLTEPQRLAVTRESSKWTFSPIKTFLQSFPFITYLFWI